MYDKDSKGISWSAAFFMLIAFTVTGILAAGFISIMVWQNMTGLGFDKMTEAMSNPKYSNAIKMIQVITATIGMLLPAFLTAWMVNRRPMKLMGFTYPIKLEQAGLVLGLMFASIFFSGFLAYVTDFIPLSDSLKATFERWEGDYNKQVQGILQLNSTTDYLIALGVMAVLPAICEEALFRGGLQNYLTRWTRNPWLAIIVVSILFSAAHFSFYGFLSRLFLGIILGLLYYYSGRLWLCIFAHFVNNAIAVTAIYVMQQQGKPLNEAISDKAETWVGVFALPIVIVLLILIKKHGHKPEEAKERKGGNEELRDTPFY